MTAGSTSSPSAAIGTPLARWATAGAMMSRPANVGPGAGSWYSSFSSATIRSRSAEHARPPARAGRCRDRRARRARPRPRCSAGRCRRPGSTTASTSPSGRYCTARARASAPARTSNGGTSWVMSTIAQLRREVEHDRVAHADELVGAPVVGEERDELEARRHQPRRYRAERSEPIGMLRATRPACSATAR